MNWHEANHRDREALEHGDMLYDERQLRRAKHKQLLPKKPYKDWLYWLDIRDGVPYQEAMRKYLNRQRNKEARNE